jgi:hypothetical protein
MGDDDGVERSREGGNAEGATEMERSGEIRSSALTRISVAAPKEDLSTWKGGWVFLVLGPKARTGKQWESWWPLSWATPPVAHLPYQDGDQGLTHADQRPCPVPIGAGPLLACKPSDARHGQRFLC